MSYDFAPDSAPQIETEGLYFKDQQIKYIQQVAAELNRALQRDEFEVTVSDEPLSDSSGKHPIPRGYSKVILRAAGGDTSEFWGRVEELEAEAQQSGE